MTWYAVSLLFESVHSNATPDNGSLWEESVVVVEADSDTAAKEKAEAKARRNVSSYKTAAGDLITWEYRQVERVFEIESDSISSGTEVFSRFLRRSEVMSILQPFEDDR